MSAWPENDGEAIHTSTFLGHPLACSGALAVLDIIEDCRIPERAEAVGLQLLKGLRKSLRDTDKVSDVRGCGLMIGVELVTTDGLPLKGSAARVAEAALGQGLILLPAGEYGHVLELTPSAFLNEAQVSHSVDVLSSLIKKIY